VEGTRYHALRNNCIAFADFIVRVLTGGAVRGAPLIFDALVGQVRALAEPRLHVLRLNLLRSALAVFCPFGFSFLQC
jgi:hypothetical protein